MVELREGKSKSSAGASLKEVERKHVLQALRDTNWILGGASGAVARLGILRTKLIYPMRQLGIEGPED